tara:strand:- start:33 stop:1625 length:1593 start_codon:yes stop_codon:yes gene_type:complete
MTTDANFNVLVQIRDQLKEFNSEKEDNQQREEIRAGIARQNKLFEEILDMQKNAKGDELEAERESKTVEPDSPMVETGGFRGKAMIFTAIIGAITGLIAGFIQQFIITIKAISKFIGGKLGIPALKAGVVKAFVPLFDFFARFFNYFKTLASNFKTGFRAGAGPFKTGKQFGAALGRVNQFTMKVGRFFGDANRILIKTPLNKVFNFKPVRLGITGLTKLTNLVSKFFGAIGNAFARLGQVFKNVVQFTKNAFGIVKKAKDGAGVVGKFFSGFGTIFKSFFAVFSTLGRVIFFPLNIIIGGIGGIIQGFKDFNSQEGGLFAKITAGFFGFIKGAFNALISSFLDLIKNGIAFIFDKLGFDGIAESLRSFSFKDFFSMIFDKIRDFVIAAFNGFMDGLGRIKDFGMRMMKVIAKFGKAVGAGISAFIKNLPFGSPIKAFGKAFGEVMDSGSSSEPKAEQPNTPEMTTKQKQNADFNEKIAQAKLEKQQQASGAVVIDNTTNNNVSNDNSQSMNSGIEQPINNRDKIQGAYA